MPGQVKLKIRLNHTVDQQVDLKKKPPNRKKRKDSSKREKTKRRTDKTIVESPSNSNAKATFYTEICM